MYREVYERIIDLARKVVDGELDPLDINVSRFVDMLSNVDVDRLPIELFQEDVEALHGLAIILEVQKDSIRKALEGLRLDSLLTKTFILAMDIDELGSMVLDAWRPPVETSYIDVDALSDAVLWFNSITRFEGGGVYEEVHLHDVEPFIEEDVRRDMIKLWRDLLDRYGERWIDYFEAVGDNEIYNSYLLSLLSVDGYVDIKVDRYEGRVYVKPLKNRRTLVDPVSIPVVFKHGY